MGSYAWYEYVPMYLPLLAAALGFLLIMLTGWTGSSAFDHSVSISEMGAHEGASQVLFNLTLFMFLGPWAIVLCAHHMHMTTPHKISLYIYHLMATLLVLAYAMLIACPVSTYATTHTVFACAYFVCTVVHMGLCAWLDTRSWDCGPWIRRIRLFFCGLASTLLVILFYFYFDDSWMFVTLEYMLGFCFSVHILTFLPEFVCRFQPGIVLAIVVGC